MSAGGWTRRIFRGGKVPVFPLLRKNRDECKYRSAPFKE